MTVPSASSSTVNVRMVGSPGIADSEWIALTSNGITVLTGRNNVGKTRVLRAIARMHPDSSEAVQPPEVRVEADGITINLSTNIGGLIDRYEVTDSNGTHELIWEHENSGTAARFGGGHLGGVSNSMMLSQRWDTLAHLIPHLDKLMPILRSLTYVPDQRTIPGQVQVRPTEVPAPSGIDLGVAIFTQRNKDTAAFRELEAVMAGLFPEISAILTPPVADYTVEITYRDRFAGRSTPLDQSGRGVAQALHLVSLVLFSEPGRIFLIDEPHVFLHPGAERNLVRFLRAHPEHSYVCATHSPVFLREADAEAVWLVTRDENGTALKSVFAEGWNRRHVFTELGIDAGDVALAEHVLFVEGPSDKDSYPSILDQLGYDVTRRNCSVIALPGADHTSSLSEPLRQLAEELKLPYTVLLDGDKHDQYDGTPNVVFLPCADLEAFVIQDPAAVRAGMLAVIADQAPGHEARVGSEWPVDAVAEYLAEHLHAETKASDLLQGLARKMGTVYKKTVVTPAIAKHLRAEVAEQLRPILGRLGIPEPVRVRPSWLSN